MIESEVFVNPPRRFPIRGAGLEQLQSTVKALFLKLCAFCALWSLVMAGSCQN
jgi:hypothetical protein